ncbi:MAG: trimeric intracellular cation channel family protein [Spirochaetales bacterium]|nr:trimeric intracellular cation channel family protein [Candidatus Physcosoma equi]
MNNGILLFFDILGTFVFALSGAAKAVKNKMDFLGVLVFAITVGCAGGMIRDVLIGAVPVAAYQNSVYMIVAFVAGLLIFLIADNTSLEKFPDHIVYLDAIGLGFFTAMGCAKAVTFGITPVGIIFSGVLSAVGGGILRDMFSKEVPMVFTSDFYASASILGCLLYLLLRYLVCPDAVNLWMTAGFTISARVLGYKLHLSLPVAGTKGGRA